VSPDRLRGTARGNTFVQDGKTPVGPGFDPLPPHRGPCVSSASSLIWAARTIKQKWPRAG